MGRDRKNKEPGEGGREEEWGVGDGKKEKGCIQTYQAITIHV